MARVGCRWDDGGRGPSALSGNARQAPSCPTISVDGITIGIYITVVANAVAEVLRAMRSNPAGIAFADAMKVAEYFFGEPRMSGSHCVFKTRWPGNPRINLQKGTGNKAKAYQVRQLLQAIEKLEGLQRGKRVSDA